MRAKCIGCNSTSGFLQWGTNKKKIDSANESALCSSAVRLPVASWRGQQRRNAHDGMKMSVAVQSAECVHSAVESRCHVITLEVGTAIEFL